MEKPKINLQKRQEKSPKKTIQRTLRTFKYSMYRSSNCRQNTSNRCFNIKKEKKSSIVKTNLMKTNATTMKIFKNFQHPRNFPQPKLKRPRGFDYF